MRKQSPSGIRPRRAALKKLRWGASNNKAMGGPPCRPSYAHTARCFVTQVANRNGAKP